MKTIYEDGLTQAVHDEGDSDYLLVTFNGFRNDFTRDQPWGLKVARGSHISLVGFISKEPRWFPSSSVRQAAAAVQAAARGRDIVFYGNSMGGYAALKHAGALAGSHRSHVLALSPQYSIDPRDVPFDERFRPYYREEHCAGMAIGAADHALYQRPAGIFVVHDRSFEPDRRNVELIGDRMPITPIDAWHTRHDIPFILAGSQPFRRLIEGLRAGRPGDVFQVVRAEKKKSYRYFFNMGQFAGQRRRIDLAESLWARAEALGCPPDTVNRSRIAANERHGRLLAAFQWADKARLATPDPFILRAHERLRALIDPPPARPGGDGDGAALTLATE